MKWADMDSDDSDDEIMNIPTQPAGLNDGTVQVSYHSAIALKNITTLCDMHNCLLKSKFFLLNLIINI